MTGDTDNAETNSDDLDNETENNNGEINQDQKDQNSSNEGTWIQIQDKKSYFCICNQPFSINYSATVPFSIFFFIQFREKKIFLKNVFY